MNGKKVIDNKKQNMEMAITKIINKVCENIKKEIKNPNQQISIKKKC
jgi:hypothetical protein